MRENWEGMRGMVTRGRVIMSALNPKRTLVQLSGLSAEVMTKIELILPYGMSALPGKGGDVILLQVGGSRAHIVAIGADDPTLRITDLQAAEFGFRDARGQQVVFRTDRLEITTPLKVVGTVGGDMMLTVTGKAVLSCNDVELGGTGGKKVVLDGDPVIGGGGGHVQASSAKVTAL